VDATTELPTLTYYRACVGSWRCRVHLTVTDARALEGSGMGLLDRLSLRVLGAWPRWLARPVMATTVRFDGPLEVVHTTTVRWLGIPLLRSVETFSLDPGGRTFRVGGDLTGHGSIDETGTRGEYRLRWLGADIVQRTSRDGDTVTVRQEGPGFEARQALLRQPRAAP
jgi:hypothetical protein